LHAHLGHIGLDKQRSEKQNDSNFVVIDADKVNIDLIRRDLETSSDSVLALYNYLLEKGIVKTI